MSIASSGTDLATKYQRLAAEYTKLRAQIPILKEAVVKEQEKAAESIAADSEKEKEIRRVTSEVESLTFRNAQLTKRVEFLQDKCDELASSKNRKSKVLFSWDHFKNARASLSASLENKLNDTQVPRSQSTLSISPAQNLLEEELQNKLRENEKLHTEIFELKRSKEDELYEIRQKIRRMEAENTGLQKELAQIKNQQQASLDETIKEKKLIEDKLSNAMAELSLFKEQYQNVCQNSAQEMDSSSRILSHRVVFDDTEDSKFNRLNLQSSTPELEQKSLEVFQELRDNSGEIFAQVANFFSYSEQRAKLYPCDSTMEDISDSCQKYSTVLTDSSPLVRELSDAVMKLFDQCQSTTSGFQIFVRELPAVSQCFQSYVTYLRSTFLPLFNQCLEEECSVSWCNNQLEKENRLWKEKMNDFVDKLEDMSSCLQKYQAPDFEPSSRDFVLKDVNFLAQKLKDLTDASTELSTQYSIKVTSEHQMPTATKRLKTTNECLLASLHSHEKLLRSTSDLLTAGKREFLADFLVRLANIAPENAQFESKSSEYMNCIFQMISSMKPTDKNSSGSFQLSAPSDSEELKSLRSEIESKTIKIVDLEKEKERLALEAELLRMKLETGRENNNLTTGAATPKRKKSGETAPLKTADETSTSGDNVTEDDSEMKIIEKYYRDRLEALMFQLQEIEGTSAYHKQECARMLKAVQALQRQKEKLKEDIQVSREEVSKLTEEIETTREGYESQMNSLSEHLAEMNVKLTSKTDEIDMLKQAMANKSNNSRKLRFK